MSHLRVRPDVRRGKFLDLYPHCSQSMYHQPIDFQHDWDLRTHKYSFRSNYLYTITNATVVEGAHSFIVIAGKDNSRLFFLRRLVASEVDVSRKKK